MRKIYLAGPEVFFPDAKDIGKRKKDLCRQYGFEGLYPLDNEFDLSEKDIDQIIYRANERLIRDADYGM